MGHVQAGLCEAVTPVGGSTRLGGGGRRGSNLYMKPPNERTVVVAIARRAGDNWTVVLLDGAEATFGKRGAQIGLIVGSLRPGRV
jgi:hypothetical protein